MPASFIGLPADGTGKKLRTRSRTEGANTVEEQAVFQGAMDTWCAVADAVAPANSKWHIGVFNGAGSGRIVKIRKLFLVNLQTGAVSGALARLNAYRTSAQSGGTAITPVAHDTNNSALPAQILAATNPTATAAGLLWPMIMTAEEETAVAALSKGLFLQVNNLMMEGPEIQELTLREGQGFGVQQAAAVTVGSFAWICVFTSEAP